MSLKNDDYSLDFEEEDDNSQNNTSQLFSTQSEIQEFEEIEKLRSDMSKSRESSSAFSSSASSTVQTKTKPDDNKGQGSSKSSEKKNEMDEIDEIFRKLEKIQRAHDLIESNFSGNILEEGNISIDEDDVSQSQHSHSQQSSSKGVSEPKSDNSFDDQLSNLLLTNEIDSIYKIIQQSSATTPTATGKEKSEKQSSERSVEELLKEYEELEKSLSESEKQASNNDIFSTFSNYNSPKKSTKTSISSKNSSVASTSTRIPAEKSKSNPKIKKDNNNEQLTLNKSTKNVKTSITSDAVAVIPEKSEIKSQVEFIERVETSNINEKTENNNNKIIKEYKEEALKIKQLNNELLEENGNLKNEITRQESLIEAFQKENEKYYSQIKEIQGETDDKEKFLENQVEELKTEIATLKLARLASTGANSPRIGSAHKSDTDRLNEELSAKSQQIKDFHLEITRYRLENEKLKSKNSHESDKIDWGDKEREYQRSTKSLQKQVRTLQKILYSKDPSTQKLAKAEFGETKGEDEKDAQLALLEKRNEELEGKMAKVDSDTFLRIKDIHEKFQLIKNKYEEKIQGLDKKLAENQNQFKIPEKNEIEELHFKLERCQAEISHYKMEINRYKREIEIMTRSSNTTTSNTKDTASLNFALKQFKLEMAEKEKLVLKFKKEIDDLKKTNNHLKREREKYLNMVMMNNPHANRGRLSLGVKTKSDLDGHDINPKLRHSIANSKGATKSNSAITVGSMQILQSTLENERAEFEKIFIEKDRLLEAKEKQLKELKSKLEKMSSLEDKYKFTETEANSTHEHLRSRIITQHKIIESLKVYLSRMSDLKDDYIKLKKEKGQLEFRNKELVKKLSQLESMTKPENEILADLTEKVEDLNSRYFFREKQIDLLLSRYSLKVPSNNELINLSPRILSLLNIEKDLSPSPLSKNNNGHGPISSALDEHGFDDLPPSPPVEFLHYGDLKRSPRKF